jgi:hypothetical protein
MDNRRVWMESASARRAVQSELSVSNLRVEKEEQVIAEKRIIRQRVTYSRSKVRTCIYYHNKTHKKRKNREKQVNNLKELKSQEEE